VPVRRRLWTPQAPPVLGVCLGGAERTGYNPEIYPGTIAVYAGCGMNTYLLNPVRLHGGFSARTFLGSASDL